MTHPYREKPCLAPVERAEVARIDFMSVAFGLCCGLVGQALAGPGATLAITLVGVMILLGPRR